MAATLTFDDLRTILIATVKDLPDQRTRPNRIWNCCTKLDLGLRAG